MCLILWNHSHSRDMEAHKFINNQMLIEITNVCYAFQIQINTCLQKSRGLLLRLIMGLGGHDNWGREDYLANVELKSGNLSETPKSQHHKITSQFQSNLII